MGFRDSSLVRRGLVAAGQIANVFRSTRPGVIVLTYHSVDEEGSRVSIPPRLFEEQMRWLVDHYRVVSLDDALSAQESDEDLVVITFDDGYRDYLTDAFPCMARHGVASTVYVVTELILNPDKPFHMSAGQGKRSLSIKEVEELNREPLVTIGSHTHTHQRLPTLPEDEIVQELETSHKVLSDLLGTDQIHFAYPWAQANELTHRLVQEYYRSAAVARGWKNNLPVNPHPITRIPVLREPLEYFKHRVRENLIVESKVREALYWLGLK